MPKDIQKLGLTLDFPSVEVGPLMQYVPDGKSIRISHFLFDADTGAALDALPIPGGQTSQVVLSQMLASDKALVVTAAQPPQHSTTIATVHAGD